MAMISAESPQWKRMRRDLDARISDLQLQLEADIGPDETNVIRGRLRELRRIIEEVEEPPQHFDETQPEPALY